MGHHASGMGFFLRRRQRHHRPVQHAQARHLLPQVQMLRRRPQRSHRLPYLPERRQRHHRPVQHAQARSSPSTLVLSPPPTPSTPTPPPPPLTPTCTTATPCRRPSPLTALPWVPCPPTT